MILTNALRLHGWHEHQFRSPGQGVFFIVILSMRKMFHQMTFPSNDAIHFEISPGSKHILQQRWKSISSHTNNVHFANIALTLLFCKRKNCKTSTTPRNCHVVLLYLVEKNSKNHLKVFFQWIASQREKSMQMIS